MNKSIYVVFFLLVVVGCNSGKKQNVASSPSIVDSIQTSELVKEPELNIANLKKSFKVKDEVAFLQQFPKYFYQFSNYFGWNNATDEPNPLYDVSTEYIDYWFYLLHNPEYGFLEKNLVELCLDGGWQADGVNYFQDKTLTYIKENQKYDLINDLTDEKAFSVLFFLFDGPHPKMDDDFASNLNHSKKEILVELFENGPFTGDSLKNTFQKNLSFYTDNESYFISEVDVNNDAILDKIVSSKPYEGDELVLFIAKDSTYEFVLKTINFSEDGGSIIKDIKPSKNGFVVTTYFPDRGFFEANYYISYINNNWILTNTIYKTRSSNQEDAFIYVCDVKQDVDLGLRDFWNYLNSIPQESERDKVCLKEKNE